MDITHSINSIPLAIKTNKMSFFPLGLNPSTFIAI
ncbi:MAG TPA: CRISPR-associated DxTHG motif protein [Candidatus Aenigmarchaeota archaeon]|nr:CRISPR-associated DxTHG motif protein [Candidatus Aenigmarchaeota archaeon]